MVLSKAAPPLQKIPRIEYFGTPGYSLSPDLFQLSGAYSNSMDPADASRYANLGRDSGPLHNVSKALSEFCRYRPAIFTL